MTIQSLGFIGLGNIGYPIAAHLLKLDKPLYVYDVAAEAINKMVTEGATAASTTAELANKANYIGICVRDDNDVNNLIYGGGGILENAAPGTYIAIHSTVTQLSLEKWNNEAKAKQIHIIDAPISGGAEGAKNGTLCYMVGGDADTVATLTPIFNSSADKIIHAGDLGTGMALKLCNNLITYFEFTAMSEATRLAEACGLSADTLREVGKSNGIINETMHKMISNRNMLIDGGCTPEQMDQFLGPFARLGRKDLECALASAESKDLSLPATSMVKDMIESVFLQR